ncbi:uncharacterized protein [Ptychodera flava]|uniref:uncharacterized protein n=1 Tax=Ptychodera flava TaxID=63121 RepID=UPI00396A7EED
MEASIAVETVKEVEEMVKIDSVTMDDDSTTIAKLHTEVREDIVKHKDNNHVKKGFADKLYKLKAEKSYGQLSTKVICYLQKCFSYALSQNSSSASDLEKNLKAIVPHAFGDHVYCDSRWCQFMKDPAQYKHRSLPYGKDLCGEDLRKDLDRVLNVYIVNSSDLVRIGSSKGNESLNMVIASKAPKAKHYSGSNSFNFRVAAAVAQKNLGHTYVSQVHKENLLSPSRTCQIYGAKLDRKTQKVNDRAKTKKGKLERLQRKEKRAQKTAATEVREGSMYEKGVGLSMSSEQCRNEIPEPVLPPDSVSLSEGSYTLSSLI